MGSTKLKIDTLYYFINHLWWDPVHLLSCSISTAPSTPFFAIHKLTFFFSPHKLYDGTQYIFVIHKLTLLFFFFYVHKQSGPISILKRKTPISVLYSLKKKNNLGLVPAHLFFPFFFFFVHVLARRENASTTCGSLSNLWRVS